MDRPKQEDYKQYVTVGEGRSYLFDFRYLDYVADLEEYCDEQEETIRNLVERDYNNMQYIGKMGEEILKLRKALEKACRHGVVFCIDAEKGRNCGAKKISDCIECLKNHFMKEAEKDD